MQPPLSPILDIGALFGAYQSELLIHLTKIVKCNETAADLTQESYLILYKTAQQQTIEHPRGFLYRIATHLAFNHLRHNKVINAHCLHSAGDDAYSPSTEHWVSQQQRLERFVQIVAELPPRCRDVLILYKVHGMSHKAIAQELGVSVSGVEKHLAKGLGFVRQRLLAGDGE